MESRLPRSASAAPSDTHRTATLEALIRAALQQARQNRDLPTMEDLKDVLSLVAARSAPRGRVAPTGKRRV